MVFPGTYNETITVPGGKNNLTIISQTPGAANITAVSPATIITVNGAICTRVSGFTVTVQSGGPFIGITGTGISVINGGSAVIDNNTVIGTGPITTVQAGRGISVDFASAALIQNNVVTNYQKTGIRINGAGTCANVINNTITGVGPTPLLAQNGIQISRGATANVENNTVTGNNYTGADAVATGILLFQEAAAAPVCAQFNTISSNNAGIALSQTIGSLVQGNNSSTNTQFGILVDETNSDNIFVRNTALNNPTFDIEDDSMGTLSAMTANIYLCNICNSDNRDGEICASVSPIPRVIIPPPLTVAPPVAPD